MNDHPSENAPAENTPADNSPSLDEQLVAYLDGELDAETSRRIEAQLASDADVRRRLQSLERTWEMLDDLDAAPIGEPFTRTTLEMVAVAAGEDLEQNRIEAPRRRRRRRLQMLGALAAAAAVGFLGIWLFTPDSNRRLLENLPVLEQFEEYRQTGNIGFLRQLRDEKLFLPKSPSPSGVVAAKPDDTAARRLRIERMKPDEKAELARIEDRFANLTPEEKQELWKLHDDLQNDSDREQLRAIMRRYCEWLKTLSSSSWESLAKMPSSERLRGVKERLKLQQSREAGLRLSGKDAETLATWHRAYVARRRDDFQKSLKGDERKKFSGSEEERRRSIENRMMQAVNSGELPPMMTDDDLSQLRGRLSEETRKQMEGKPSLEQWRMVMRWLHFPGPGRRPGQGAPRGSLPNNIDVELNEHLADFFEKKLSDDQRDRLLAMPSDEMYRRLVQMYQQSRPKPSEGPAHYLNGPWRDRRRPGDAERPPHLWHKSLYRRRGRKTPAATPLGYSRIANKSRVWERSGLDWMFRYTPAARPSAE